MTRYNKKKQGKKQHRKHESKTFSTKGMVGFPSTKMVRMRYCQVKNLDPTTSLQPQVARFRCNSIFDPDATTLDPDQHQPLGYDEWSVFYNHYLVVGAKITVQFIAAGTTASYGKPVICAVRLADDTTIIAQDTITLLENPNITYKAMSRAQTQNSSIRLRKGFSPKKFFTVDRLTDNFDRLGAAFGANPNEQAYFEVLVGNFHDVSENPPNIACMITIDYMVLLSEPKEISQSTLLKFQEAEKQDEAKTKLPPKPESHIDEDEYETIRVRKGSIQPN